jgi:hypothetical protein
MSKILLDFAYLKCYIGVVLNYLTEITRACCSTDKKGQHQNVGSICIEWP